MRKCDFCNAAHICVYVYMYMYVYINVYVCIYVGVRTYVYAYIYMPLAFVCEALRAMTLSVLHCVVDGKHTYIG